MNKTDEIKTIVEEHDRRLAERIGQVFYTLLYEGKALDYPDCAYALNIFNKAKEKVLNENN